MLHQKIIEKYQINVGLLPEELQHFIKEAARLQAKADGAKVYRYSFDRTGLNAQDQKILSDRIEGDGMTIEDGLVSSPPLFVAKSTNKNFGLTTYVLWLDVFNFKTVTENIYNAVQLPNIQQYKEGTGLANTNPENVATLLEQLDGNISQRLMGYLRGNVERLGEFVGGGGNPLSPYMQDDLSTLVAKAFGSGFFENGEMKENYGHFGEAKKMLVKTSSYISDLHGKEVSFWTFILDADLGHLMRIVGMVSFKGVVLPYLFQSMSGDEADLYAFDEFDKDDPKQSKNYAKCLNLIRNELGWLEVYQADGAVTDLSTSIAMLKIELN